MKNRRFAIILLICITYFLLPTCKPTLYEDHFISGEVEVQAGFNEDRSVIEYTAVNRTDRDILYEFVVLECQTSNGWQEILDRTFQRQTELGRTAVQPFFPANETIQGSLPLTNLRTVDTSAYRLVFPFRDTSVIAVSTVFS